ncbi:MAG: hypothetical protein ABI775_11340 [Pseudonocardiales bacterium]
MPQPRPDLLGDHVGRGMRMLDENVQDRNPLLRDAQTSFTQRRLW